MACRPEYYLAVFSYAVEVKITFKEQCIPIVLRLYANIPKYLVARKVIHGHRILRHKQYAYYFIANRLKKISIILFDFLAGVLPGMFS